MEELKKKESEYLLLYTDYLKMVNEYMDNKYKLEPSVSEQQKNKLLEMLDYVQKLRNEILALRIETKAGAIWH